MKTPIVYYGGKTRMLKHIMPLLPEEHRIYVEPFIGGGAVFFRKPKAEVEVINDNLDYVVNFYKVVKTRFPELQKMVHSTLHSEKSYLESKAILKDPANHDEVTRAWAFWCQAALCFSHSIFAGFAFAKGKIARSTANRIDQFTEDIANRLRHTQVFCRDAIDIIKRFDSPETFFYLDPPYPNSECGNYRGSEDIFYQLLEVLPSLQGKWLLSSYPNAALDKLRQETGCNYKDIGQPISVSGKQNIGKRKVECLTWNYKL